MSGAVGTGARAPLPPALAADLALVRAQARQAVRDRSALVSQVAADGLLAGGKGLRAALCLLAGRCGAPARREVVLRAAAGLELVHLASLVHDDVIDRSPERRGRPAAWALWGNRTAVLGGDYLFSCSFDLLFQDDDPRILRIAARAVRELVAGAIQEQEQAGDLTISRAQYFQRIHRKTAHFISAACRSGAVAAAAPPEAELALATYGRLLGLAFQIADDILDLAGDPAVTGKPAGSDLRGGLLTLPTLYGRADPAARAAVAACFGRPGAGARALGRAVAALQRCGALAMARREAGALAWRARAALRPLARRGPAEALEVLDNLAAWCVDRDH